MDPLAHVTHKATGTAVACCLKFLTLVTVCLVDFLESVLDIKQVMDVKGSLEAWNSILGQCGELSAVGALHCLPLGCLVD